MQILPKEYEEKGYFIISEIEYKEKTFIKCGNINDILIYFFEINKKNVIRIQDEEIQNELIQKFALENSNKNRVY